jgi:hypothetical protein
MTICAFRDKSFVKCKRKADSSFNGKPYCNKHLQILRRAKYDKIDYPSMEDFKL